MCEVTRKNFNELFDEIMDNLHSASFISIDCEFSGLFDSGMKCTLFDTPKARFKKLQNSLDNFVIIQFGLSTFKYESMSNTLTAFTYSFYLKPATALENRKFTFQPESVEFLCKNKFNFNKLFHDGIYYLNKSNEREVLNKIKDGSLLNEDNTQEIQKYCSNVSVWVKSAAEGEELILELDDETTTFYYLLHQEIRKRFPGVQTHFEKRNAIRIKKTCEEIPSSTKRKEELKLQKKLFESILGFSIVMKEIEKLQKPIIGHNVLLDLIMIYKQFYNPLPVTYKEFKRAISRIFPNIFDTKSISFSLREYLTRENTWNSNALLDLYQYLKHGKGASLVIFSPLINHRNEDFISENHFHDAGFDSYCTGFCFLKMAHIFSLKDEGKNTFKITSMYTSIAWLLGAVADMKNKVNMSRGQVNYICLDGEDPKSSRPGLLYFDSKKAVDMSKLTETLAKYGSLDIQLLTKCSGVIAVSNRKQVKELLERFKNDKELSITKYNILKHSDVGRTVVSVTFIASIVLVAVLVSKVSGYRM